VEAGLGLGGALRAKHNLLGDLRAAGQHAATLGRPEHELEFFGIGHPLDMVSGFQSFHDLSLSSTPEHFLVLAVPTGLGTFKHKKNGVGVLAWGR
jgi:hypothetical protein